jgi:cytochrome b involved in lipid metabolism
MTSATQPPADSAVKPSPTPPSPEQEAILFTYKGEQYNATKFLSSHPGGKRLLLENNNSDITEKFDDAGHSERAGRILLRYKVDKDGKFIPPPKVLAKSSNAYEKDPDYNEALGKNMR